MNIQGVSVSWLGYSYRQYEQKDRRGRNRGNGGLSDIPGLIEGVMKRYRELPIAE
jgi:hypothetical protein